MKINAFPFGSATSLATALRTGKVSSVELLQAYLARVDRINPSLNALVVDDRAAALKRARAADRARAKGESWGALHGLPMTVKESFDLQGQPTTWGHVSRKTHVATQDALAVQRLKAAGAVIFGKSNVPLNLADFQSYNKVYGTSNNPWDLTRGPGGSSGGSAALVAAGLTGLEYGSDIGGSIRNPAAYCGVYGHKPTWCIVPKRGHSLAPTAGAEADLSVVGPIARSAADLALALKLTAGPDLLNARGVGYTLPAAPKALKGLRVAVWLDEAIAPVDDSVKTRVEAAARALAKAGAKVDFKARPDFDPAQAYRVYSTLLQANLAARRADFDTLLEARSRLRADDHSEHAMNLRAVDRELQGGVRGQPAARSVALGLARFFRPPRHDVDAGHRNHCARSTTTASRCRRARCTSTASTDPISPSCSGPGWRRPRSCLSTVAPAGLTAQGLPVGVQIVGPEMADLSTIWLAAQLAQLIGGFTPPPGL